MDRRLILGIAGALLLAFGVFVPIVSIPVIGGVNYFQNGRGDGALVLVLACASIGLALRRRFHWLWTTGVASVALLIGTFIRIQERMLDVRSSIARDLADNPFRGIAEAAAGSMQIQWGWVLLVMGACLLLAAASLKNSAAFLRKCPYCAELIKPEARVCKHCTRDVDPESVPREARMPRRVAIVTALIAVAIITTWINPLLMFLIRAGVI